MAATFAFVGQKGGSGKTTMAICAAAELVARGRKVLLVDLDPQGSTRTWAAVAAEAGQATPVVVIMDERMHRPGHLDAMAERFDMVLIDTPPWHAEGIKSALMASDVAVVPCGPSPLDGWGLASTFELISHAREARPELKACVAITKQRSRTVLGRGVRAVLASSGYPVLGTEVRDSIAVQEAMAAGQGVAQYAPSLEVAADMRGLVDELLHFHRTGKARRHG